MKKNILTAGFAGILALLLAACSSTKNVAKTDVSSGGSGGKITSKNDLTFPLGDDVSARFFGTVYFKNLIQKDSTYNFPVTNNITFAPGSHSGWHVHGGMEVLVTGGRGYYQAEGEKAQIIQKGDVLHIPAGVKHWHGATPDSYFSQIVIYDADWKAGLSQLFFYHNQNSYWLKEISILNIFKSRLFFSYDNYSKIFSFYVCAFFRTTSFCF